MRLITHKRTRKDVSINYWLNKSSSKWTENQSKRAEIRFQRYPDLEKAYKLCQNLSWIFNNTKDKTLVLIRLAKWDEKVRQAAFKSFNTIARTMSIHYKTYSTILTTEVQMLQQNLLMPK